MVELELGFWTQIHKIKTGENFLRQHVGFILIFLNQKQTCFYSFVVFLILNLRNFLEKNLRKSLGMILLFKLSKRQRRKNARVTYVYE